MTLSQLQQNNPYCNVLSLHGPKRRKVRGKSYIRSPKYRGLDKKGDRYLTERYNGSNWDKSGPDDSDYGRTFDEIHCGGEWGYRRLVRESWESEIGKLESVSHRRIQKKRLAEFEKCGQVVKVRRCESCGSDREGSGTYEGTRTCKTRACPTCGWIRSKSVGEFLEGVFDRLEGRAGWRWQMIVTTIRYDPEERDDLSVDALRSRALLAIKVGRVAWNKLLKVDDAAMLRSIECSKRGHVHLNMIYFGPEVDKIDFEEVTQAVDCRVGFSHVRNLDTPPQKDKKKRKKSKDPRGSKEALETAARYISKGIETCKGGNDEDWLAGDRMAKVVSPTLAARWEIATYRLKLLQKYGAIRGMKLEEHGKKHHVHDDDSKVRCPHCGAVGAWKTVLRRAEYWLQQCHDRGSPGLVRSVWTPRSYEHVEVEDYV